MRRLTAKIVRSGLVTAWRLAGWPTRRSPSSVNATIDGVVRMPSAFSMTFGVLPSMTATHELVVPRSIPMTLPIFVLSSAAGPAGPVAPREHHAALHADKPPAEPLTLRPAANLRRPGTYRRAH